VMYIKNLNRNQMLTKFMWHTLKKRCSVNQSILYVEHALVHEWFHSNAMKVKSDDSTHMVLICLAEKCKDCIDHVASVL
jgi:hypothetical protein